jgi:hypothetical protein
MEAVASSEPEKLESLDRKISKERSSSDDLMAADSPYVYLVQTL